MNDQTMPAPAPVDTGKFTVYSSSEHAVGYNKRHFDHKRLETVADAILGLTHTEFKRMCADLHSGGHSIGSTPAAVEDCVFEYANRIMAEASNNQQH
jgi:hypothetical protein